MDSRYTIFGAGVAAGAAVAYLTQQLFFSAPAAAASKTEAELARLRKENEELVAHFSGAVDGTISFPKPAALQRHSSFVGEVPVNFTAAELSELRRIFELFDTNRDGSISATELVELHSRMGEPISGEEAVAAIESMSNNGTGVSFEQFVQYWDREHFERAGATAVERKNADKYRARFKFVKAKIANPELGMFTTKEEGEKDTTSYRVRFYYGEMNVPVSPWHNVPYKNRDGTYNFVCEIPKWTRKKYEIATGEPFNAIKQDTKNGKLREYGWGDMMFNYGAFPQTWESPEVITEGTGKPGDNDPLDAIEIGNKQWSTGSIVTVKINDVEDIETHLPGLLPALKTWLRLYKSQGGIINEFGFGGNTLNRGFAEGLIEETHEYWEGLIKSKGDAATV